MISSSYWVNPWKSAMSCAWFLTWSLGIILINLVNADLWSMTYNLRWHQQTGRVRTFGNPLLHKSNENTGKIVRIKTSKLWKLIKGLKWFLEHLFKKKRLNFGKNIEFYGILTCLNLTSSSIASWKWISYYSPNFSRICCRNSIMIIYILLYVSPSLNLIFLIFSQSLIYTHILSISLPSFESNFHQKTANINNSACITYR